MIFQALKEYYDRKAADPDSGIAPPGFEWKEIPYVIVLDANGLPVSLNCTYEGAGTSRRAKRYLVPKAVKKTVNVSANLLWENPEYALGVVLKAKKRTSNKSEGDIAERVAAQHLEFQERIDQLAKIDLPGLTAVKRFLARKDKAGLLAPFGEAWEQLLAEGANVSFQLAGDSCLVLEMAALRSAVKAMAMEESGERSLCLVTGEVDDVERLHPPIKGVWGSKMGKGDIVSFNHSAFTSYRKIQGGNAPVGRTASFSYTTALNHLLEKGSKQRMQVGDASTVFWSEKATEFEGKIVGFFVDPPKDDPDRNTRAVEALFSAVRSGALPSGDEGARFYVLGLAPNISRISVRFWVVDTVKGMAEKICRHFEDTRVVHGPKDRDTLSLFRLLVSTAVQAKAENIPPNLAGGTMRSILEGVPYPGTLLRATIQRIRAERDVTYPRAALIKACINRSGRCSASKQEEELKVSLDDGNGNVGYRLGRLFAVLEKIQSEANPGINATIRDRFYGAASSTPVTVFGNLMRLKNHHVAKIEHPGRRVTFERLIGEIMSGIADFPPHLRLEDQGRFAVGYYHQMQDL